MNNITHSSAKIQDENYKPTWSDSSQKWSTKVQAPSSNNWWYCSVTVNKRKISSFFNLSLRILSTTVRRSQGQVSCFLLFAKMISECTVRQPNWSCQSEWRSTTHTSILCSTQQSLFLKNTCWPGHKSINTALLTYRRRNRVKMYSSSITMRYICPVINNLISLWWTALRSMWTLLEKRQMERRRRRRRISWLRPLMALPTISSAPSVSSTKLHSQSIPSSNCYSFSSDCSPAKWISPSSIKHWRTPSKPSCPTNMTISTTSSNLSISSLNICLVCPPKNKQILSK